MGDWWKRSACEQADAIAARTVTSEEVVTDVVARIRARNGEINAITYDHGDEAIDAARAADRALARGESPGPLHGVPVTIKVNVDVAGQPSPNGIAALEKVIAPDDAPIVRNLKRAGAIVVGRTNAPEYSMRLTTWNPMHGRTVNPWHPDASPGGSSGGAGAAAAAGFGAIHHGNDIAGSLRFPAFTCGVATVKPTQGRMPAFNPSAAAERGLLSAMMSTQGVIAREVGDVRLGSRVMCRPDPRDPLHVPLPFDGEPLPGPIRVTVTRNAHGFAANPGVLALIDRAASALSDAGYDVVEVEPPPIVDAARAWFRAGLTDVEQQLGAAVKTNGSEELQRIFEQYYAIGELLDLRGFQAALAQRTGLIRRWTTFLDDHPLVLCPFLFRTTYPWDYDARGEAAVRELWEASIYSCGFNFLGLPTGIVPVDLVEGLPAGVQIVGRRFREDTICDALEAVERSVGVLTRRLWERDGEL
jgi:amidase